MKTRNQIRKKNPSSKIKVQIQLLSIILEIFMEVSWIFDDVNIKMSN